MSPNNYSPSDRISLSDEQLQSPGAALREAREAAALSLKEVADKLNLVAAQIAALEEDRYEYFKAEVFCKGYLRSYGKLMDLETTPLLDAYRKLRPVSVCEHSTAKIEHVQTPKKGNSIQYWCIAIVAAVGVWLWSISGDGETQPLPSLLHDDSLLAVDENDRSLLKTLTPSGTENTSAKEQIADAAHLLAASALERVKQLTTGDVSFDVNAPRSAGVTHIVPKAKVTSADVMQGEVNGNAVAELNLRFSADCWVQVTDRDNNVLVADLKNAEDVLKLRGAAPFKVVLGYAPAVSLEYNGQSVEIGPISGSNTAKIVVGQS